MSSRPLLEAHPDPDEVVRLRREIVGLEQELQAAREEAVKAKQASADSIQAIRALRHQLDPLYKSLKMIFGEISRVDIGAMPADRVTGDRDPRWESWKTRLSPRAGEIIELLLVHREMNTKQISAALKEIGRASCRERVLSCV
jgi:hypothetical protein